MQLQEDKKKFAELFSKFTGINQGKVEEFLKTNDIRNAMEHPSSLDPTVKQLEKIEMLKEMNNLYENLKGGEQAYAINSSAKAQEYFKNYFTSIADKERFVVAFLNTQNKIIHTAEISKGTINEAPVYPREITKLALQYDAHSAVLAHNHPGGRLKESQADMEVTKKVYAALKTQNIAVVDHIIAADGKAMSFAEQGIMDNIAYEHRVREGKNSYEVLGQKIEAGQASAEEIKQFNSMQETQLKESIEEAKGAAAAAPETELTR